MKFLKTKEKALHTIAKVLQFGGTKLLNITLHRDLMNTSTLGNTRQNTNISMKNCCSWALRSEYGLESTVSTRRDP